MEIKIKEIGILEKYFKIYEDNNYYELEQWTNGGVDMIIDISKNNNCSICEYLKYDYLQDFDIDKEIDIHRQDKNYRDNFTIRESLQDFESWVEFLKNVIDELESECEE